ncbi:HupE/UreJ family protein [Methylomonas sp. ZR1]|uniref:HupE/UreJ family protein n=1 Tax=Methylomonas sp. ZR1 TaxID=1797072 RepID=UPI0014916683|nr:HupE/UreJ family protein [Methylomonas sp. ZR1]NOV30543.1 hypothetical protein [Methylomonas sp. ZR1]
MQFQFQTKLTKSARSRLWLASCLALAFGLLFPLLNIFGGLDNIGWNNGFSHPLGGWDHLLTMLAVGIWAAQLRGQAIWMLPLAFVGVMSLGGLAGAAGLTIPSVEGIILLSCAVFAVLITRKIRFSAKLNVFIVAFFAFFHGFAHGQEISTSASLLSYTLGFMLATLLLHGAGILVAKLVVLTVTCLLTLLFSQAAMTRAADAMVSDTGNITTLSQNTSSTALSNWTDLFNTGALAERSVFERQVAAMGLDDAVSGSQALGRPAGYSATKACATDGQTLGLSASLSAYLQNLSVLFKAIVDFDGLAALGNLHFRQLFPDINHTPGTQLCSSGVGRTSPPAYPNVFVVSTSFTLRKSPVSTVEAPRLQPTFASTLPGDFTTQSFNELQPDALAAAVSSKQFLLPKPALCAASLSLPFHSRAVGVQRLIARGLENSTDFGPGNTPKTITTKTITQIEEDLMQHHAGAPRHPSTLLNTSRS